MSFDDLFRSTLDRFERFQQVLAQLGPARTKHPGSKKHARLVKTKRRRQNKAARIARRHNRRPNKRPKGRRKP